MHLFTWSQSLPLFKRKPPQPIGDPLSTVIRDAECRPHEAGGKLNMEFGKDKHSSMVHVSFAANLQSTGRVPNRIAAFRCELPKAWSFNVLVARHSTGWEPSSWWLSWFIRSQTEKNWCVNITAHQIAQWKHQLSLLSHAAKLMAVPASCRYGMSEGI